MEPQLFLLLFLLTLVDWLMVLISSLQSQRDVHLKNYMGNKTKTTELKSPFANTVGKPKWAAKYNGLFFREAMWTQKNL